MNIEAAFSGVTRLYVDTAPFIYFAEARAGYVDKMRTVFSRVSSRQLQIFTSAVTIPETMMKPLQASDRALADRYRTIFYHTRGIKVLPISLAVADRAAELRAKHNLRTPDALHVASAITSRCDAFLTNDAGIKRVDDIKVLILGELALRVQNGNEADNGSNM